MRITHLRYISIIFYFLFVNFCWSNSLEYLKSEDPQETKPPIFIGDSLHDYLYDLDKQQLQTLALALDYYHLKSDKTGTETLKIEQHVTELSANFLREFIAKKFNEHPEINDILHLEKVVSHYKITQEIKSYLAKLPREDLIKLSYICEKQHKKEHGMEHALGGLHDYIWKMSDDGIKVYIMKESEEHEELNSVEKLNLLLGKEGNSGIKTYLSTLLRDDLVRLAFKCEEQHKKAQGSIHTFGGLHDFIWSLSDDQIREYIMKETREHAELNSTDKLSKILKGNDLKDKDDSEKEKSIEGKIENMSKPQLMKIIPMILEKIDSEIFNAKLNYNYMTPDNLRNFVKFLILDFKLNKDEILKEVEDILKDHTKSRK